MFREVFRRGGKNPGPRSQEKSRDLSDGRNGNRKVEPWMTVGGGEAWCSDGIAVAEEKPEQRKSLSVCSRGRRRVWA